MTTDDDPPQCLVIAGPNGAGKSTAAAVLLPRHFAFVNADEVAKTLPGYPSTQADREAARIVLRELDDLARDRMSFALETTLAGRSLAARCLRLKASGYRIRLLFVWSPSAEFCIQRVASRVRSGGHDIAEADIRRRYVLGIRNFFGLYRLLADKWVVLDATGPGAPRSIAEGTMDRVARVDDPETWAMMQEGAIRP